MSAFWMLDIWRTGVIPHDILQANSYHQLNLNILNFHESLPLTNHKIINFLVKPVNFGFRMDAHLIVTFIMETVSPSLTVLALNNDRSLN